MIRNAKLVISIHPIPVFQHNLLNVSSPALISAVLHKVDAIRTSSGEVNYCQGAIQIQAQPTLAMVAHMK